MKNHVEILSQKRDLGEGGGGWATGAIPTEIDPT